ncbi:MAG: hypothetical protein AB7F66_07020 [Bacteriovoracia bacterium]
MSLMGGVAEARRLKVASPIDPPVSSSPLRVLRCPDFNRDGVVNNSDITAFSTAFNANPAQPAVDFDGNGQGDVLDIVAFIENFRAYQADPQPAVCGIEPPVPQGWTDLVPSSASRMIYVSSSTGSDSNPGTISLPYRTLAKGYSMLRSGQPDYLYLKRGDTWRESLGLKKGVSPSARQVITAYGTGARPRIAPGSLCDEAAITGLGSLSSFLALTDLEVDATGCATAFRWGVDGGRDLLLEGNHFHDATSLVAIEGITDLTLRRNIFSRSSTSDPGGGNFCLYLAKDHGNILVEENVFDQCGGMYDGRPANLRGTAMYIQQDTISTVRKNLITRSGGWGAHHRGGGVFSDNLIVDAAMGFQLGMLCGGCPDTPAPSNGVDVVADGNIVMDAHDVVTAQGIERRGLGMWLEHIHSARITNTIIARKAGGTSPDSHAVEFHTDAGVGVNGVVFAGLKVFDWPGLNGVFTRVGGRLPQYSVSGLQTGGFENPYVGVTSVDIQNALRMRRGTQDPVIYELLSRIRSGF